MQDALAIGVLEASCVSEGEPRRITMFSSADGIARHSLKPSEAGPKKDVDRKADAFEERGSRRGRRASRFW